MPKLRDVCRHIRSKNAGPFWITVDLFFDDVRAYAAHHADPAISAQALAGVFAADVDRVKWFAVPTLNVVKFSYPRAVPQGGAQERDMHGGQQYLPIMDIELGAAAR